MWIRGVGGNTFIHIMKIRCMCFLTPHSMYKGHNPTTFTFYLFFFGRNYLLETHLLLNVVC